MNCINTKHPEFVNLVENSDIGPFVLEFVVSAWQKDNNSSNFPNLEEVKIAYTKWQNKKPNKAEATDKETTINIYAGTNENAELQESITPEQNKNTVKTSSMHPESFNSQMTMENGVFNKEEIKRKLQKEGSEITNFLLDLLFKHIGDDLTVEVVDTLIGNNGKYNSENNTIVVSKQSPNIEGSLVHELLHAATVKMVTAYRMGILSSSETQAMVNLEALHKVYKRNFRNDGTQATESLEEFITGVFTNAKVQKNADSIKYKGDRKTLLEKFFLQMMSFFGFNSNSNTVLSSSTYNIIFLLDGIKTDLSNIHSLGIYDELTQDQRDILTFQYAGKTIEAKEAAEKLLIESAKYELSDNGKTYIDNKGIKYIRVGDWYQKEEGYSFTGDKANYEKNRTWGNQIDLILTGILLNKSLADISEEIDDLLISMPFVEDSYKLNGEILAEVYDYFNNWVTTKKAEGYIILPQITVGNKNPLNDDVKKSVAGTLDVILIDKIGKVDIVDLKSSIHSVYASKYKQNYGESKSTRDRHSMQLGAYKGILYSKNIEIGQTFILPVKLNQAVDPLTGDNMDEIEGVVFEEMMPIIPNKDAIKRLSKDGLATSSYNENKGYDSLLDSIMTLLKEKIIELKNNGNKTFYIESLQEELSKKEPILAIEHFINDTYIQYYGPDNKKFSGYLERMVYISKNSKLTEAEKLVQLEEIQDIVLMYERTLKQLEIDYSYMIIDGKITANAKDYSTIDNLNKLITEYRTIGLKLNRILSPIQAKILADSTRQGVDPAIKEQITKMELILKQSKAAHDSAIKEGKLAVILNRQKSKIEVLQENISRLKNASALGEKDFLKDLNDGAREDISFVEFWFRPFISSSNKIVATVARKIKSEFEKARLSSWNESLIFAEAFERYKKASNDSQDDVEKFNRRFYKTVKIPNGEKSAKETYILNSDINWTAYQDALIEAQQQTKNMDFKQARKHMSEWYKMNTKTLQKETIYATNPITGEKTVYIKGMDQLIEEKKQNSTEKEFDYWLAKSKNNGAFSLPADVYSNVMNLNAAEQEYYDTLLYYLFRGNNELPNQGLLYKMQIPSITKNSNDRVRRNGIKNYFEYNYSNSYEEVAEDIDIYGEKNFAIPIMYRQSMPIADVSLDLGASIMRFFDASEKYKIKKGMLSLLKSVHNNVKASKPGMSTERGLVKDWIAKQVQVDKTQTKNNGGYIADAIEQMINIHIYGKNTEKAQYGKIDANKVTDAVMGLQSLTTIAANPLLSLANSLMGNVSNLIEAAAGKHFTISNWTKSLAIYFSSEVDFMTDFNNPVNKSKMGQLLDVYDSIQGDFSDRFGRKMTMSAARKAFSSDTLFYLQHKTEHQIQSTALIAKLLNTKVTINGVESTLYDAYELKNGKLSIKNGTMHKGIDISNQVMIISVQEDMHSINKDLQGVYNSFDKPLVEKYWWGRLLMMYRKFIVPGVIRRFGNMRVDIESNELKEGTYKTFLRLFFNEFKELGKFITPGMESETLTQLEKENVRRTLMDLGIMIVLVFLCAILKAAAAGDDDDDWLYWVYYPVYRLRAELMFFINPLDGARVFKTPTIAYSLLEKILRVFAQLFDPFEAFQRDQGLAEKGDYKLPYRMLNVIGANGRRFDPEEALKLLKMQTN